LLLALSVCALCSLWVCISLETSSSSCVDDDAVDGDGDDGGGDDGDGFCSAFAGRMLLLHLGSFVGALLPWSFGVADSAG
jgi:hypothetical protein